MSYLFAPAQREVLEKFARSKVFLAFDFDGTLAPIVDHPRDAAMRPGTKALLRCVTRLYPCAVISGRGRADVRRRLSGTGVRAVVGNHGADLGDTRGLTRRVARWGGLIERQLADLEGVWVENKGLSLSVHYRNSPEKREARRRLQGLECFLDGAKFAPAKQSVSILDAASPDKGEAIQLQFRQTGCERAIFVGDDATDEDVFTRDWGGTVLGVAVGTRKSAAAYYLRDQAEIDRLLERLAALREPGLKI